MEANCPYYLS